MSENLNNGQKLVDVKSEARAEWRKPEWRVVEASGAEANANAGPDGGVLS